MNTFRKEIEKIEKEIIRSWEECKEWEEYNGIINDITRSEILEKIDFIKKLEKLEKKHCSKRELKKRKVTYKEIAKEIHKTEAGVKYIAKTNPDLLEILKLGIEAKYN